MILKEPCYSFCDLQIVPEVYSNIRSRQECNPFYTGTYQLPIFTAPMDSVADHNNYQLFEKEGIIPIIHRNVPVAKRLELTLQGKWCAYRLTEVEEYFNKEDSVLYQQEEQKELKCLLDVANGHMTYVFELASHIKTTAYRTGHKLVTMTGNIANPVTYQACCDASIDYVRCSIGTGSLCLTSSNTACGGYPNATLIDKIVHEERSQLMDTAFKTKIIADGGIRNYNDIIIALALGADYVMIGGLFGSFIESCGDYIEENLSNETLDRLIHNDKGFFDGVHSNKYHFVVKDNDNNNTSYHELINKYKLDYINYLTTSKYDYGVGLFSVSLTESQLKSIDEVKEWILHRVVLKKSVHGMSSKEAQIGSLECQGKPVIEHNLKTSEGKVDIKKVNTTIHKWTDNFISYMQSAMSYTGCRTIEDFISKDIKLIVRSQGTQISVNK